MKNHPEDNLRSRINAIEPDIYERLERISEVENEIANQVVTTILQFSCCGQNIASISAGKNAFKRLPEAWSSCQLPSMANSAVNFNDQWEYRRFVELLKETDSSLLGRYIELGLISENDEVREAANDLSVK